MFILIFIIMFVESMWLIVLQSEKQAPPFALQKCSALKQKFLPLKTLKGLQHEQD